MFLFFLLGLLVSAYIINKIYFGKSSAEIIQKESEKTHKNYQKEEPLLIPWREKDLNLMSYHVFKKSERKGFGYSIRGIFTSVYQEHMFIFQHKKPTGKSNGFTIAITKEHEIWYDDKNRVYINGEYLGQLNKKGDFGNSKLKRVFGTFSEFRLNKYEIRNEEDTLLGAVKVPEDWEMPFPRALEIYSEMNSHDSITFKVMVCKRMIETFLKHEEK